MYGQLTDAAAAWHDSGEDPSFLYRGAQLAALQQAFTRWPASPARSPALTGTQRGFLPGRQHPHSPPANRACRSRGAAAPE